MRLHALRQKIGPDVFDRVMDEFGRAHHRGEATIDDFAALLGQYAGAGARDLLTKPRLVDKETPPQFSTRSFLDEPEDCLIVYGTLDDTAANRIAASALQELIRKQCRGIVVNIVSDEAVKDTELGEKHLLLIGGPEANRVAARCVKGMPVTYARHTCTVKGETYANATTCVIVAGANPVNPRYSAVILGGLSAAATHDATEYLMNRSTPAAEVLVCTAYSRVKPLVVAGK